MNKVTYAIDENNIAAAKRKKQEAIRYRTRVVEDAKAMFISTYGGMSSEAIERFETCLKTSIKINNRAGEFIGNGVVK